MSEARNITPWFSQNVHNEAMRLLAEHLEKIGLVSVDGQYFGVGRAAGEALDLRAIVAVVLAAA